MSDSVLIALIGAAGIVLAALVPALVAVLQGRKTRQRTADVHAQLVPNGGSSMRDAVNRLENKVDTLTIGLQWLNMRVEHIDADQVDHIRLGEQRAREG